MTFTHGCPAHLVFLVYKHYFRHSCDYRKYKWISLFWYSAILVKLRNYILIDNRVFIVSSAPSGDLLSDFDIVFLTILILTLKNLCSDSISRHQKDMKTLHISLFKKEWTSTFLVTFFILAFVGKLWPSPDVHLIIIKHWVCMCGPHGLVAKTFDLMILPPQYSSKSRLSVNPQ